MNCHMTTKQRVSGGATEFVPSAHGVPMRATKLWSRTPQKAPEDTAVSTKDFSGEAPMDVAD